jgi:hypothetical protein
MTKLRMPKGAVDTTSQHLGKMFAIIGPAKAQPAWRLPKNAVRAKTMALDISKRIHRIGLAVQDARWEEFEALGEEEVRKRLAAHIWGEDKGG